MKKLQLISFISFMLVIPLTYLLFRFDLFHTETKFQISLWGVIALGILLGSASVLIYYYISATKTKYSLLKQILEGLVKVTIPLIVFLLVLIFVRDNVGMLIEAVGVIAFCETIAVVINPFPKWCFENNIEGLAEISNKIFHKKGE